MELAGDVPAGFAEELGRATLTLVVDGERVVDARPVAEFMGPLPETLPKENPMIFGKRSCLFLAHKTDRATDPDSAALGYFLPVGTQIQAEIRGAPQIPEGTEVSITGVGLHYSPGGCNTDPAKSVDLA